MLLPDRLETKIRWSEALRRAFGIDIVSCSRRRKRKVFALLQTERQCVRKLVHLGLPALACELEQARRPPEAFELPAEDDFVEQTFSDEPYAFAA